MQITVSKTINVSADRAWQKLGMEFAEIAEFFSQVDVSRPIEPDEVPNTYSPVDGAPVLGRFTESRVIKATEVLTAYSDRDMTFSFDAVDAPAFLLSHSTNTTRVVPIDADKCTVEIRVTMNLRHVFNILAPVLRIRMGNLFSKLIAETEAVAILR